LFRRIRFDLRAIQGDMAEFDQSCRLAQLQNLQEQRAERLQMPLAEVVDGAEIRRIQRHNHHKIVPLAAGPGNAPRRIQPTRIAMQQKRHHHPRIERRLPEPAHIAARYLLEIEALPHKLNDKPRDMAFRHKVLHIRRQKQRLIDIPGTKILAHSPSLNQTRSELNSDYSDRLLGPQLDQPGLGAFNDPLARSNASCSVSAGTALSRKSRTRSNRPRGALAVPHSPCSPRRTGRDWAGTVP